MAALTVAWISEFGLEWLPDLPEAFRCLPKSHPQTWQPVLLSELEARPDLKIHILVLRKKIKNDLFFQRNGVSFHVLKVPSGCRAPSFFWLDTLFLKKALQRIQPDLIHAWGTERGAALVASRLPYPYLVTIQGLLTWYKEMIPLNFYERFAAYLEQVRLRRAQFLTTESTFAARFLHKRFPHLVVCQAEHAPNWLFHRVKRTPKTDPV